jgi:3-hydroxyisobutyrate dehydrogenase-like beta-hydroxyacid dehydrogenase
LHVGLVGLGRMGSLLARRLLAAGAKLVVNDVDPAPVQAAVASGARSSATCAELARTVDVVITCLPGPAEVEAVYFGPNGLFAGARPGTAFVETSTIDVELSRRLGAACAERALTYVDAPLSGGVARAASGTLTVMAGGTAADVDKVRRVIETFADRIIHVGATAAGHAAKLINQIAYLGYVALVCEATRVADAYGITRNDLVDVLRNSVGGHPLETHWEERLVNGDRSAGFAVVRALKDLSLGAAAAADAGCETAIFDAARAAFERAVAQGHGENDMSVLAPTLDI